jgi:hypothetical protein
MVQILTGEERVLGYQDSRHEIVSALYSNTSLDTYN